MSSWGGATTITSTGGSWINNNWYYELDTNQNTATSRFFELTNNGNLVNQHYGIEFRDINGATWIYVNSDDNNLGSPLELYTSANSSLVSQQQVSLGDIVYLHENPHGVLFTFTVTSSMLWSSGGTGGNSGSPTPTGAVFYDQPFDQLYFRVYKTSPLSSATSPTVHYAVYHDGSYDRTLAHGNPNVDVTTVETNPADGLWQLIYLDDTTFVVLGSYTIGQRKRSLTFWE